MNQSETQKPEKEKPNAAHTALVVFCIAATVALAAVAVMFGMYYAQNANKLFVADIAYAREPGPAAAPLVNASFEETRRLQPQFQWGGCRAEKHDLLKNTFSLHCWGLANDVRALEDDFLIRKKTAKKTAAGESLTVADFNREKIDPAKKFLILLSAFCYHRLHINIVAPEKSAR